MKYTMPIRDWPNLPTELLELIVQKLISNFVDIIRFRAVCKSWRLISIKKPINPPPQLPWLMLPTGETIASRCSFFSLSDNKVYSLACDSRCSLSSSHGWLFVEESCVSCSLLNPVKKLRIVLPLRSVIYTGSVVKAALSSSPGCEENKICSVMLIVDGNYYHLAFLKLGDNRWTRVTDRMNQRYEDVIYFKGDFYAVDTYGRIVVCDLGSHRPATKEFKAAESFKADKTYLVESSGELLLVRRFRGWSFNLEKVYKTVLFIVLHQDPTSKNWVQVKTLRGHTLFLGYNQSLSVLSSDFSGCKGNCIYFTDNCYRDYEFGGAEPHDVGIFNLEDGHIDPLPGYYYNSLFIKQPPIWITASPW